MFKLGKKPFVEDKRDFKLAKYVDKETIFPVLPASYNHDFMLEWGMLGNDQYGDCVIAGADHETMIWTDEGMGKSAYFNIPNTLLDYQIICGEGDNGCNVRDVLKYRQKTGITDGSQKKHKIGAYLSIDDHDEIKMAIYLFSVVGVGIAFPDTAMDEFDRGEPWSTTITSFKDCNGGHYVPLVGYDANYLYCITWGRMQKMTWKFFDKYVDEAWAMLSEEMVNNAGVSPEGFSLQKLQDDLNNLTHVSAGPNQGVVGLLEEAVKFLKKNHDKNSKNALNKIQRVILELK
jgi:hypothetical protein